MKKIILLVVAIGLLMGGCGSGKWVKRDMTRFEEDNFGCDYKATMMSGEIRRLLVGEWIDKIWYQKDAYNNCMRSKGYWYERSK